MRAGEKGYITVSAVIPLLSHIKEKILAYNKGYTDFSGEMKSRIMNDLDFVMMNKLYILDCFKFKYVLDQDTEAT